MDVTIYLKNGTKEKLTNIFSVDDDGDFYTMYKCHNMCDIYSLPINQVVSIKIMKEEEYEHKEG